jgi:putative ABC transport system permease protein
MGTLPVRNDIFIPHGTSKRLKKLPLTSVFDMFPLRQTHDYSAVGIKLTSPKYVEPVKKHIEQMGFETFAMVDQLEEIKTGFLYMDMFLLAVGMIGITVAALGIINTMVMSIMERYKEIGIIKAVGATNKDVKKIFFFEAGVIGFFGGVFGLVFGRVVSEVINQIINYFLAEQGVPYNEYFSFSWWLCAGAVIFSILVSLAASIYPTLRAARVDPVVALRHD